MLNSERQNHRLWVYALIGVVLTAVLYYPIGLIRANVKFHYLNHTYWNAVQKGDFERASKQIDLNKDDAAEWVARAEALYDEGVKVVGVYVIDLSDDGCLRFMVDVSVEYDGHAESYMQHVSPHDQAKPQNTICRRASFGVLSMPYNSFNEQSERMNEIRLVLSSTLRE